METQPLTAEQMLEILRVDKFDPENDLDVLEGLISELASRTTRPTGYPFSEVVIYGVPSVYNGLRVWSRYLDIYNVTIKSTENLSSLRKFNFKVAGKILNQKVKEAKIDFDNGVNVLEKYNLPPEAITVADVFDPIDEPLRKTSGDRKFLIECKSEDCPDLWNVIQFRKAVKKYITEDMGINITPEIFRDSMTSYDEWIKTGKDYVELPPLAVKVTVELLDCKEGLYQALQEFGEEEFSKHPIRLILPNRQQCCAMKYRKDYITLDVPDSGSVKLVITAIYPKHDIYCDKYIVLGDGYAIVKNGITRKWPKPKKPVEDKIFDASKIIYQTGVTEKENYPVFGGVFALRGTHGFPLEIILYHFEKQKCVVDWLNYIEDALKDGGNIENIKSKIESAVGEIYGPKCRDDVMKRIRTVYPGESKIKAPNS